MKYFNGIDVSGLADLSVGDVAVVNGYRVKVTKKTTTAMCVVPYRWYHALADRFIHGIHRV